MYSYSPSDLPFYDYAPSKEVEESLGSDFQISKNILTIDQAWEQVHKFLGNESLEKQFKKVYGRWYEAFDHTRKKYEFFLKLLKKDQEVCDKYLEEVSTDQLEERLVFAMHHCIRDGERIVEKLSSIPSEFVADIFERQNESSFDLIGRTTAAMWGGYASSCEKIGVCICRTEEPYTSSCLMEKSILQRTEKQKREISKQFFAGMSDLLDGG